jgi:hypothetical protein
VKTPPKISTTHRYSYLPVALIAEELDNISLSTS